MPVSTDGVLLGAWALLPEQGQVLDIGTGTGLLALMAAQRYPFVQITAIDIDKQAVQAATKNCLASPWSERIQVIPHDVKKIQTTHQYAGIICNPPYFTTGKSANQANRALARHTLSLTHQELLFHAYQITTEQGIANFILPTSESMAFIDQAILLGWYIIRLCEIATTEKKTTSRVMMTLAKIERPLSKEKLTIEIDGLYSDEFVSLTKDFYLKM